MIHLKNVSRKYLTAEGEITVLNIAELNVEEGATVAIVGPSGSGKSTLLSLLAGLDTPTTGSIRVAGQQIELLDYDSRTKFRLRNIGFIFQSFRLLDNLTAIENVAVPGELLGKKHVKERAKYLLNEVGLSQRSSHFPSQLSGGEQQRVAIARAFMSEPKLCE
jgi:putative ABC transport system ATP-binding protein